MKKQPQTVRIRGMQHRDVARVARIHKAVLPTAAARSGIYMLETFYQTLLSVPSLHHALIAESNGQIIGAITGTLDAHQTSRHIHAALNTPNAFFVVLGSLLTGRVRLGELFERQRTDKLLHRITPPPYASILTVVVDQNAQHQGTGSLLLRALEQAYPNHTVLYVDTESANTHARRFYEKNGFALVTKVGSSVLYSKKLPG